METEIQICTFNGHVIFAVVQGSNLLTFRSRTPGTLAHEGDFARLKVSDSGNRLAMDKPGVSAEFFIVGGTGSTESVDGKITNG